MGFMDEIRKLTQPYDDDDNDFFEGADTSSKSAPSASPAQLAFENTFGEEPSSNPEPARRPAKPAAEGGLLGALGVRRAAKPKAPQRERTVNFGGSEQQVILFNPRTFDEAGELVTHLNQGRSLVMTLEGLPTETARRLLDFLSGVAYANEGKIKKVAISTYIITPYNVDILGDLIDELENNGLYF